MSAIVQPIRTSREPSAGLRRFAWAVLGYFIAVIVWGGVVRATGSGAGCGDHWPLCNGTVLQPSATTATLIEFSHRITSALSFFAAVGLLVWTLTSTVRGHLARAAAWSVVGLTIIEAILGALLVKLGYTAQSTSPARPAFLALHLTNTLLLVAALALTAHFLSRRRGQTWETTRLAAPLASVAGIGVLLAVGVTGSLAALGDTLFPASSISEALSQDFATTSTWLVRWRWTHPTAALVASGFLVWMLLKAMRQRSNVDNRPLVSLILVLIGVQYLLGIADVVLLAPVWLQSVHLIGADVLWASLVVLAARLVFAEKN